EWANPGFFPQTSGYVSIGSGQTFLAPADGALWLGFNDDAVGAITGDNSGQVLANINVANADVTGPAISITVPNTVYALNQQVAAKYSCTDPDDLVATCTGPVANGANVDTSTGG